MIPSTPMPANQVYGSQSTRISEPAFPAAGTTHKGPGDHLHDLIRRWLGQDVGDCHCQEWIDRMNAWGPDECRDHVGEIVSHILAEAKNRGWWKVLANMPGARWAIRQMVNEAIGRS